MQKPSEVMQSILYFLANADQVLMMDANIDDRPSYNFIQCLARLVNETPRWIRNTYVRPPMRTAHVYVCRSGDIEDERALQAAAINKTMQMLQQGFNVYAPSTQKEHVKLLAMRAAGLELGIPVFITTSETEDVDKDKFADNLDEVLLAQRMWASSPTITAGISFESKHFTRVVGYARNAGELGATVDCFVQQLGRVRDLGDAGELHIYVCDPPHLHLEAGPVDEDELDRVLQVRPHPPLRSPRPFIVRIPSLQPLHPFVGFNMSLAFYSSANQTPSSPICNPFGALCNPLVLLHFAHPIHLWCQSKPRPFIVRKP